MQATPDGAVARSKSTAKKNRTQKARKTDESALARIGVALLRAETSELEAAAAVQQAALKSSRSVFKTAAL